MAVAGRSRSFLIRRVDGEGSRRAPDDLVVEEPLEIRLDGVTVTTTMRTPGHDLELAAGFCHTEGLLHGTAVRAVRYCGPGGSCATRLDGPAAAVAEVAALDADPARYNVVEVDTGGLAPAPTARLGPTTSSCGLCGSASIDDLRARIRPLDGHQATFPTSVLAGVPGALDGHQPLFDATGAVHAAAAFDLDGRVVCGREDVGRHNAVDKVVGHLLLDGRLPAADLGLYVSGRVSFEIVAKAWAAGIGTVVAVSAPTSLAVQTARSAGMVLAGFARGDRLNLYAPE